MLIQVVVFLSGDLGFVLFVVELIFSFDNISQMTG